MTYSKIEKKLIIEKYKSGMTHKEIIETYNIPSTLLYKWINKYNIKTHLSEHKINKHNDLIKLKALYEKEVRKNQILSETLSKLPIKQIELMNSAEKLLDKFFLREVARVLDIPYATFYHHVHNRAKEPLIKKEDDYLKEIILKYFNESGKRLGIKKNASKIKSK